MAADRPEPIMLKNLPIILSRISQNYYPLFPNIRPIILKLFLLFIIKYNYVYNVLGISTITEEINQAKSLIHCTQHNFVALHVHCLSMYTCMNS